MDLSAIQKKKYAIVLGCGYDGTGITRAVIEMLNWCERNGVVLKIYCYENPPTAYQNVQAFPYTHFKKEEIESTLEEINTQFDVVMIHSLPLKTHKKDVFLSFYHNFIKKLTPIKVGFNHCSTPYIMNNMSNIVAVMNEMDLIYSYGPEGFFGNAMDQLLKSKNFGDRIKRFNLYFDFSKLEDKRKVPFTERDKKIVYIGRYASFKSPANVLTLGKKVYDKDPSFKTEMHGIYASMDAKINIFDNPYAIRKGGKKDSCGPEGCVDVYGAYVRDEMMEHLSKCMFGCSFFYIKEQDGNHMEYAQIEMVASGCIPIFHSEWAKQFTSRFGMSYYENPYSAIYVDKDNITDEDIDKILEIANDPVLAEKYREGAIKYAAKEFDVNEVLPDMFLEMATCTPDTEKYKDEKELILGATGSQQFADMYDEYKDELVVFNPSQLMRKNLTLIEDGRQRIIKHFK